MVLSIDDVVMLLVDAGETTWAGGSLEMRKATPHLSGFVRRWYVRVELQAG